MRLSESMLALILSMSCSAGAGEPPDLYITPYLQNVTPTGITVMWETADSVRGTVAFGREGELNRQVVEKAPVKLHEIHLTGLEPGQTYTYRVRYGKEILPPASFTTAPPPGVRNWRLVVYGDNRSHPDTHAAIVRQIAGLKPAIVLNSGDLVARGTVYELWKKEFFDPLRGLAESVPVYTSLGNHEKNADFYYRYMSLPDENGESYYSFNYANAHIISLNSNAGDAPFQMGEAQTEWLIQDLKANQDAEWKIVFFHHPLFSCHPRRGVAPQRWVWQPIFDRYGVDLVINGHDHYYERTYAIGSYTGRPRRGVYHLVSGGGGAGTYPVTPRIHAAFRRPIHHFVALDVMGDRIVGRAVDTDGNAFDAFVCDKQAVNSPEEFVAYGVYELERDLSEAIRRVSVATVDGNGARIDTVLEVPNPFRASLRMAFSWKGTNGWQVTPQRAVQRLQPGEPIRIPIRAEREEGAIYPVPSAVLAFSTPDGKKAFRNDIVTFYPLKVWVKKVLHPALVQVAPRVDGDLSDAAWSQAPAIDDFVDVQGDRQPEHEVKVQAVYHGEALYLAAWMEAPEGITTRGYEGRDNRRAPRDDHFRVHIGAGKQTYTFLITAHGTKMDTRGGNTTEGRKWNSGFEAAASPAEGGWQAEMAIPLNDLDVKGRPLRINLARRDAAANTEDEFVPTFGRSSQDLRVPMFRGDWEAVERFAALELR